MSRVPFTKLGLKKIEDTKTITINDVDIEVKQYLPIQSKLDFIANVISNSIEMDNKFANPVKEDAYFGLAIIDYYTNITFTDKQRENVNDTYDKLESNDIINKIISVIPEKEYNILFNGLKETSKAMYQHLNSALGILETVSKDYSDVNLDIDALTDKLSNSSEDLSFLKEVLNKLD